LNATDTPAASRELYLRRVDATGGEIDRLAPASTA